MLSHLCRHSSEIRTYSLPELSSTKKEYLTTHCYNLTPLSAGKQYHPKSSVRKNKSGNVDDKIKTWMNRQLLFSQLYLQDCGVAVLRVWVYLCHEFDNCSIIMRSWSVIVYIVINIVKFIYFNIEIIEIKITFVY